MWDTVSNIAAIVVILLLFQLLGLPDWIDRLVRRRDSNPDVSDKLHELESRISSLEKKIN